jgi:hypothetical protein
LLVPPKGTASLTDQQLHAAKIINDFENPVIENVKNDDDVENTSLRLADDDDIFAQAQRIADEEERKRRSGNDTNTTDPNPTQAQKEAGNYKKKHLKVDGYDISIENERGSMRSGVDKDGAKWEQKMHNDYGYIRGTEGVDGDHIDLFLSDHYEKSGDVYVIDQVNKDGSFDEHKVMCGFDSEKEARDAYLSNYEKGWTGLGAITRVSRDDFKKWVDSSHRKTKPFAEYASVKRTLADDDDINFRIDEEDDNSEPSRRMGLANRISAAATEMSQNHQDNVNMRSQALAAIGHGGIKTIKRDRCPSQPLSGSDKKKINSLEKYRRIIDSQK